MKPMSRLIIPAVAGLATSTVFAAGTSFRDKSVRSSGMALAADGVATGETNSIFANPAVIGSFDKHSFALALTYASAEREYKNTSPGATSSNESVSDSGIIPTLSAVHPINDKIGIGWGFHALSIGSIEAESDFFGRYHNTRSTTRVTSFDVMGNYKVNKMISVGLGIQYQMVEGLQARMVDGGLLSGGALPAGSADFEAEVTGTSSSAGFLFGLAFAPQDNLSIGFGFRSGIKHTLEGDQKYKDQNAFASGVRQASPFLANTIKSEMGVEVPATYILGGRFQLNKKLGLNASFNFTEYSALDELVVKYPDFPTQSDTTILKYSDSLSVGLGADFALSNAIVLRGGLGIDGDVGNDKYRSPITAAGSTILAFGGSYLAANFSIDASFSYYLMDDFKIDQKANLYPDNILRGDLKADVTTSVWYFGLGGSYHL